MAAAAQAAAVFFFAGFSTERPMDRMKNLFCIVQPALAKFVDCA
jgi:hypothetical protein